ncbi:MAG TPA: carboxypeptidase-like regulatory domain-containing protein [Polyangiales bacterium]|nr:carboxypeptidase-like regulatory domain-containing protein [Polyangiales bacterium]
MGQRVAFWARAALCLACCWIASAARGARADASNARESALIGRSALAGVDQVLSARPGAAFVQVAGSAGYGLTESQAGEGAHHRLDAIVAAAIRPIEQLAVSLSFDGRYDAHPGGDDGAVGLPRLTVLGSQLVAPRLHVGAALALTLPGQQAPSLDFGAAVVSVLALGTLRVSGGWLLSAQLGFRVDNSAHAAPDLARLSRADRLALGASDFNALPLGVAATKSIDAWQLSAELSGEILLGGDAPSFLQSPLRAAVIARTPVARDLSIELFSRLSLSQRPDYARLHPLLPVEPRLMLGVGLRFAAEPAPAPQAPARSDLRGSIVDAEGAPISNALVVLRIQELAMAQRTKEDGSFRFENLPRGAARVQVTAEELEPLERALVLDRAEQTISLQLSARIAGSQLRGLVRSFDGVPLPAQIRLLPDVAAKGADTAPGTSVTADNDGRFVLELAPGSYRVEIECSGYRTQRRNVIVQKNGVTLLNVELRAQRH